MNALTVAREVLVAAADAVLPGRVFGYSTTRGQRGVAPYVWLEAPTLDPETVGTASTLWVAVFPVRVVVDGAAHAQVAELDEVVTKLVDSFEATRGVQVRHVEPGDVDVDASHVLRGATLNVAVTITARTLCPPQPVAAVVPPEPIPA